jgi:hypothetical protein
MLVVAIWGLAGLVVALYVLFVVWRLRVDRRKKAMQEESTATMSSTIARAAAAALPVDAPAPRVDPSVAEPAPTVAEALTGISLPNDLAPLTSMAARGGTGDRVAFWTTVPPEVVGPAFGDELERLGYTVTPLDEDTLAAQRGDAHLIAIIHPDGPKATIGGQQAFETVPELSTVIEVWIPL